MCLYIPNPGKRLNCLNRHQIPAYFVCMRELFLYLFQRPYFVHYGIIFPFSISIISLFEVFSARISLISSSIDSPDNVRC